MKKNYTLMGLLCLLLAYLPTQASNPAPTWALICPDDVTVDCDAELWDLSIYGNATYHNSSGYHSAGTPVTTYYLNSCGSGYITRKWTLEDPYWNLQSCTQTITVGANGNFNGSSIVWPAMVTLEGCNPNTHPDVTGKPTWVPAECSMLGYSYSDALYTVTPDCKKILRKWTVIDWCQMPTSGGYYNQGSWTFTQTIKIVNSVPPGFSCIPDITVSAFDCKFGKVVANPLVIDPSSCGGNFEITNNSPYSTEKNANISGTYPVGTTKVTMTIKYGCGQKKTCLVNVTVKNDKAPIAVCVSNLSVALMGIDTDNDGVNDEGMVQLWAKDLNWKSYSTCNNYPLRYSFSTDPNEMSKTFTCEHVGKSKVRMYVTDSRGNQTYCEVELDIQNNGANIKDCKPKPPVTVAGRFSAKGWVGNIYGKGVKGSELKLYDPNRLYKVNITYDTTTVITKDSFKNLSGYWVFFMDKKLTITEKRDTVATNEFTYSTLTDDKGLFVFDTVMQKNASYTLKCPAPIEIELQNIDKADLDLLTSVILGQKSFAHNWQYLAADLNKDGKINTDDLALMVKYLTGEIENFVDQQFYTLVVDDHTNAMKSEIMAEHPNWTSFDSVKANIEGISFLQIQLGDINPEKFAGIHSQEEIEATYRNIVSQKELTHSIYPNPFNQSFEVELNMVQGGKVQFVLYDGMGKVVLNVIEAKDEGKQILSIDAANLPPSIYVYTIETPDGFFRGKLVKENN